MNRYDPYKIRIANPLIDEILKYGIDPNPKGFAECPFHDEKTPSFKVYSDGTYYCFGCGAHGDVIDFTMAMLNISFHDACERLSGDLKYSDIRKAEAEFQMRKKATQARQHAESEYWKAFDFWKLIENSIEILKPKNPEEEPDKNWIRALSLRSGTIYRLDCAETELIRTGNKVKT